MFEIAKGFTLFREDLDLIVRSITPLAGHYRNARILITGGTGFFGIWLLEGLLYADQQLGLGLKVVVLSRDPERFLAGTGRHLAGRDRLTWIKGEVLDADFSAIPFNHVIHAASLANLDNRLDWAERHFDSAVFGTKRLIDAAMQGGAKNFLAVTSGAVYGLAEPLQDGRFVEGPNGVQDYASERHVYGQAKRTIETMVALASRSGAMNGTIARCFAFVGPYLPLEANYAIGNFIRDALADKPIVINGDGTPLRSYLYATDLVAWLLHILMLGVSGRPYNVGGDEVVSIRDLAFMVNEVVGGKGAVQIAKSAIPGAAPSKYLPSIDRVRVDHGLLPQIPLRDAIKRTAMWHRQRA